MRIVSVILLLLSWAMTAQNRYRNLNDGWTFHRDGENKNYVASVPGTIHTDLLANQLIPDPFFGDNEQKVQWVDKESWVYETTFGLSADEKKYGKVDLVFDGLDTYAEVTLNGKRILNADNMFRTWKIPVAHLLQQGNNTLRIIFKPIADFQKAEAAKLPYTLPESARVFTRKAQYHFGWDWGPKLLTCGIWKPASLHFHGLANLGNIGYEQALLTDAKAEIVFKTTIACEKTGDYILKINSEQKNVRLKKGTNTVEFQYDIHKPKRWWCNGLGEPFLYPFAISLSENDIELDARKLHIGLRTIELVQEKDNKGKSFYFKLNGVPVFMKGANYIPPDNFLPRVTRKDYERIVNEAVLANMNMLRVWGGGVYPDDAFYEACDRRGILVWQDFMFACAMYPGDDQFLASVRHEIADNVNRLQNHASLALWCGNNENDEGWHNWGWQKQFKYSKADSTKIWNDYEKLFHRLIPKTLDSISQKRFIYWPSSPSIGWGRKESLLQGDSHYWGVWWGNEPFDVYEEKVGRFMSEYGFQGMPPLETFKDFTPADQLNLSSASVKNHQKHPTGYQTIDNYMARDYKIPTAFQDYIYVSQLLQADGMKTAMEAHRRKKPYCMGSLYWQLNDCWPVTSWSSIDAFGRRKALHYQARRSFADVLVSAEKRGDTLSVFIVNDNLQPEKGLLTVTLLSFDGKEIWTTSKPVVAGANESRSHLEIDFHRWKQHTDNAVVTMEFQGTTKHSALYFMAKPKDLKLRKPNVTWEWLDEKTLQITTDVLAKNVFLSGDDATFDDNYFDLLPGEKKTVTVSGRATEINIKTLYDTL
ncbi:Beta-mannosidase [Flavobacterium longum]|uniref:glycoside hydrolase family 2 protein n=1 Tax=Flavobacterium longum TaxID=1299340 RepID=UPI0039E9EF3F